MFANRFRPCGLRYKLAKKNNKLSAIQILFNITMTFPGDSELETEMMKSPVFKAKNETEDGMTEVLFDEIRR